MKKAVYRTLFALSICAAASVNGQPGTQVNTFSLDAEAARVEAQRKDVFSEKRGVPARGSAVMPGDEEVKQEMQKVDIRRKEVFSDENLTPADTKFSFPNVPTPGVSGIDIQALAKRYEQRSDARKTEDVLIFVSFSMPPESLRRAVAQANSIGAAVVLRGFKNNSMKETSLAVKELGLAKGNVMVNPNAFTKYKIDSVPAVVLAKADASAELDNQGCALPDTYAAVFGDVSLDYALEEIGKGDPSMLALVERYTRQLRGAK